MLHSLYDQPNTTRANILAFTHFPVQVWHQIWSTPPPNPFNHENQHHTDTMETLPTQTPSPAPSEPSWPNKPMHKPTNPATST